MADTTITAPVCLPLTAARVEEIFMDCLFKDGEATDVHVPGEGVMLRVGFHPERLAGHRDAIRALLQCLPDEFHDNKGGGTSFLNACMTREGEQWAEHRNIDQLLALGVATGQATVLLPRSMWGALPGGVPYFSVVGS